MSEPAPSQSIASGLLHDFFLSYRHLDNTGLTGAPVDPEKGEKGWVDYLEEFLRYRVPIYRGKETTPWRDTKSLRRHEQLTEEILRGIRGSRLFLPVLSLNYATSRYCPMEFDEFIRKAKRDVPGIDRRKRLFKILRTTVPAEEMHPMLRDSLGFEFYHKSDDPNFHGTPIEPSRGEEDQRAFAAIAERLAREVAECLQKIDGYLRPQLGTLYLASRPDDVFSAGVSFEIEFRDAGYELLPTAGPPLAAKAFDQFVSNHLDRSRLSVHLLGEEEGALLSDGTPAHHREFDLALERCRAGQLQMFVWLPQGLQPEGRQAEFLKQVRMTDLRGFDLLDQDFPELLSAVRQRLKEIAARAAAQQATSTEQARQVFLLYDLCDRGQGHLPSLRQHLRESFQAGSLPPLFEGEPAAIRQHHDASLAAAQAVIVYWGNNAPAWAYQQQRELPGVLRPAGKHLLFYLGPPETDEKTEFSPGWGNVIRAYGEFDAEAVHREAAALFGGVREQ